MNAIPTHPFDPSVNAGEFRGALGAFATGITVVTTGSDAGPVAMVANSFASVSLDPPLVLWSPAKSSRRFSIFADAPYFGIHVLAADQRDVCAAIVGSMEAIREVPMHRTACGMPVIDGALASFDCSLETRHDAGDHVIVVGRVLKAHRRAGAPLLFHNGKYGELKEPV